MSRSRSHPDMAVLQQEDVGLIVAVTFISSGHSFENLRARSDFIRWAMLRDWALWDRVGAHTALSKNACACTSAGLVGSVQNAPCTALKQCLRRI